jgi:hypothetical protein
MTTVMTTLTRALLLASCLFAPAAMAADAEILSDLAELRAQLLEDRRGVVTAFLDLSDREGEAFWPVYEAYQVEVDAFRRQCMNMVLDFLDKRGGYERAESIELMRTWLDMKQAWVELERTWLGEFLSVLPARKALRYYQIENKIDALINAELAAFVPLAGAGEDR